MIYFDTDVLINYLIEQDKEKNAQAVGLYNHASEKGEFFLLIAVFTRNCFRIVKIKCRGAIL